MFPTNPMSVHSPSTQKTTQIAFSFQFQRISSYTKLQTNETNKKNCSRCHNAILTNNFRHFYEISGYKTFFSFEENLM